MTCQSTTTSAYGTTIAYQRSGDGTPLIWCTEPRHTATDVFTTEVHRFLKELP